MSNASIHALKMQVESGKLETDAAYILNHIKSNTEKGLETCLFDMENLFSLKTPTIVARLSGLEDKGLIYKDGTKTIKVYEGTIRQRNVKYTKYYYEKNEFIQARRREDVFKAKRKQVCKSLYIRFGDSLTSTLKEELMKIITN